MPKATINLDDQRVLAEDDIGLSRQFRIMEAKAVAKGVERVSNSNFRLGMLRANV